MRRDAHHARLAVDEAAAVGVDVERVVGLDPDAGPLEHLERPEMDVVELGLREHLEAEPARAGPPGMQVALHSSTSVAKSLCRCGDGGWGGCTAGRPAPRAWLRELPAARRT